MAATNAEPQDVLNFWLDDVGPAGWYNSSETLDADIRARFEGLWNEAQAGKLNHWLTNPTDALAFLILTDQFPRNMFRDTGKAFPATVSRWRRQNWRSKKAGTCASRRPRGSSSTCR